MAKKQFKAESKRMLDLMVNSIYTHKEIFLRELISNASDALDKLYFMSLTSEGASFTRDDFEIRILADLDKRILTIRDNGCGMSKAELEENLGTIAKSGTLAFRKEMEEAEGVDVIGQFGVGFYSAFMVASNIKVISRVYGSDEAYCWESSGEDGYTVQPCEKEGHGTDVILCIREDTEDEKYSRFLRPYGIESLVKKYSDYIRYPIRMMMEKSRPKDEEGKEFEKYMEDVTVNSMIPIWRKNKSELTDEDYNNFYKDKFSDYEDPILTIHTRTEGALTYDALLYIPSHAPFDLYSKEYKRGLQLYSSGVMVMDKCEELLPSYFGFVHGLADSADLSLNISRELLQHDRQLRAIAANLKKKLKAELVKLMENDRAKYEKFYSAFGLSLKYGVYEGYGVNGEFLRDLILFHSLASDKLVSLQEYVDAMPEEQKYIYYACGENLARTMKLPQTELVRDKGFDILCMVDDIDEFAVKMLGSFGDKPFKSVSDDNLDLASDAEKEEAKNREEGSRSLLDRIKDALAGSVQDVRLSTRLKSSPVCLTSEGPVSIEMEKVLNAMPLGSEAKAERVLEINPSHPIFAVLENLQDESKLEGYARLLYDQALLIEGLPVEDPVDFSNRICELMI